MKAIQFILTINFALMLVGCSGQLINTPQGLKYVSVPQPTSNVPVDAGRQKQHTEVANRGDLGETAEAPVYQATTLPHMGTCGKGRTILVENRIEGEGPLYLHIGGEHLVPCSGAFVEIVLQQPNGGSARRIVIPPGASAKFVFKSHGNVGGYPTSLNGYKTWWIDAYDASAPTAGRSAAFPAAHVVHIRRKRILVPFGNRGYFPITDWNVRNPKAGT